MDPGFLARLERQARDKLGLSPLGSHPDTSVDHPPPLPPDSGHNGDFHLHPHPHPVHDVDDSQADDGDEDEDDEDDGDDGDGDHDGDNENDEALRDISELPEELEDRHLTQLDGLPIPIPTEHSDEHDSAPPNEEAEDDEDDGTTESDPDEPRPKKPDPIPTIRLTLPLPTKFPISTPVEQSVSLLAKEAGYTLPADTAITFGASAVPEPEQPPPAQPLNQDTSTDVTLPPPKRRRRKRIQERDEGYDKDDPFVDDSEAFIMEPKYYHPPARDGYFVAHGAVELKSDSKQTRVRKPTVRAPKKPPLGEVPSNPPQANDQSKPKRPIPPKAVPESSSAAAKPIPPVAPQAKKVMQIDASSSRDEAPRPISGPPPKNVPLSTTPSQKSMSQPLPSTSKAPSSGTIHPVDVGPTPHTTRPSHSNSPKLINGEARSGTSEGTPKNGQSPAVSSTQPPRQRPSTSQRHSGTPHDPIYLGDDEDHQAINQPSSDINQSSIHETGASFMSVAGPSHPVPQHVRPPYLKARSLPERTSAGPLPRPLEEALDGLKAEIEAVSPFVPKRFPAELRPSTLRVAQLALDMNEYDECFFVRLAQLFPYNTFTIKKYVKREILPQRKLYYQTEINRRIERLKELIMEGMPAAREDHEAAMREYQKAKRAYDEKITEEPSGALPTNASTILGDTVMKNPHEPLTAEPAEKPPKTPFKSFKITPPMRELIYEMIKLEDELCETIKDTQKIVDKNVTLKDTSNRRQFYLRLAQLWPDDFMTTQKLSREVANMKKKHENTADPPPQVITVL
ncbi:hypothetical protein PCASD_13181 [Puccinia coronata f. sp. avenae]|uniref:Ubinuclein middle domain-containing protein n=1 Tax=Puccinia coronata f. sp. avenae TaxID=200324 RepID=A0A2N5T2J8_9BASI|nr:hypothetical protein PCASD_13181 [Puccinia coronata f. sp. avenae]